MYTFCKTKDDTSLMCQGVNMGKVVPTITGRFAVAINGSFWLSVNTVEEGRQALLNYYRIRQQERFVYTMIDNR